MKNKKFLRNVTGIISELGAESDQTTMIVVKDRTTGKPTQQLYNPARRLKNFARLQSSANSKEAAIGLTRASVDFLKNRAAQAPAEGQLTPVEIPVLQGLDNADV